MFRFLDWMMELPEGLKQAFWTDLEQYERERQMPYVTSIEQIGIEKGREAERQTIARNLLRENIPLEIIAQATGLTIPQLQQLQADQQQEL